MQGCGRGGGGYSYLSSSGLLLKFNQIKQKLHEQAEKGNTLDRPGQTGCWSTPFLINLDAMRYRYDGISPWKQRAFEFSRIWFIESIIMTSGKCLLQNQCFVLIRLPLCINLGCFQKPPDSAKVFYERLSSFVFFLWGFIKRQT
jgi:hypothetical protein